MESREDMTCYTGNGFSHEMQRTRGFELRSGENIASSGDIGVERQGVMGVGRLSGSKSVALEILAATER